MAMATELMTHYIPSKYAASNSIRDGGDPGQTWPLTSRWASKCSSHGSCDEVIEVSVGVRARLNSGP